MSAHDKCNHLRGDWIKELAFWLCADCFEKMDSRPVRYSMVHRVKGTEHKWIGPLQQITWQAEQAIADGVTFNDFLRTMARRYMSKTRPPMHRDDAYDAAISFLRCIGDPFGDPAYDWSRDSAREFADDDMSYWDRDEAGND